MTPEEIRELIEPLKHWRQEIDLGHGITTPGRWGGDAQAHISEIFDEIDFTGTKVLDIGCSDGRWTFEAERRGAAEVHAIDLLLDPREPGRPEYFKTAAGITGSTARYDPNLSVYDVALLGVDDFDIVLFMGVYYHLRHPLLALARLRRVMREGGLLVVEGQIVQTDEVSARFFYRTQFGGDPTNWWVPSPSCLREWIESSYFFIEAEYPQPLTSHGGLEATARRVVLATAVNGPDPRTAYSDPDLAMFDSPSGEDG